MLYLRRCRFDPKRFEIRQTKGDRTHYRDRLAVPRTLEFEQAAKLVARLKGGG